ARIFEMPGRETQAAKRDERVAPPVGEPRITCDDRFSRAARDHVRIRGPMKLRVEALSSRALVRSKALEKALRRATERHLLRPRTICTQDQDGFTARKIEADRPR